MPKFTEPSTIETGKHIIFPMIPMSSAAGIFLRNSAKGSLSSTAKKHPKSIITIQLKTERRISFNFE
ncbi:hypothetical protein [Cellulophaga baltica]|uniref:hypothetical protein n=1 Tax=Cellulophaga baltica TaxID=76594 RepID=UPI000418BDC7|nr:hypothetical protein [Cellulophaga baltica]